MTRRSSGPCRAEAKKAKGKAPNVSAALRQRIGAGPIHQRGRHYARKGREGSDRVSNLTLACHGCNVKKGSRPVEEFLSRRPEVLRAVLAQAKAPLRDAAAANATRRALRERFGAFVLSVECGSGGRTKGPCRGTRRRTGSMPHASENPGVAVRLEPNMKVLVIEAMGRGARQMCRMDKYGFPRTRTKAVRTVHGFRTGDLVRAEGLEG